MNLENLNFKKGLIRLFIVSIVGAPIYGLLDGVEQMNKNSNLLKNNKDELIKEFNNPKCDYVFKEDIKESKTTKECSTLEIYSDSLLKYQKDNLKKYPKISGLLIRDYMSKESQNTDLRVWFQHSIGPVILVLTFWFVSYFGFRILRWIYRGFKN